MYWSKRIHNLRMKARESARPCQGHGVMWMQDLIVSKRILMPLSGLSYNCSNKTAAVKCTYPSPHRRLKRRSFITYNGSKLHQSRAVRIPGAECRWSVSSVRRSSERPIPAQTGQPICADGDITVAEVIDAPIHLTTVPVRYLIRYSNGHCGFELDRQRSANSYV
jgi:hypothetical protein